MRCSRQASLCGTASSHGNVVRFKVLEFTDVSRVPLYSVLRFLFLFLAFVLNVCVLDCACSIQFSNSAKVQEVPFPNFQQADLGFGSLALKATLDSTLNRARRIFSSTHSLKKRF